MVYRSSVSKPVSAFDSSNVKDLTYRILFTLCLIIVCRIGIHIPLPGVRADIVLELVKKSGSGFFGMLDMFSGGAISNMSIMAMGLMPYISSSIIVQLIVSTSPSLSAIKKDAGEAGQRKISQYTRYGAVIIGVVQSFAIAKGLEMLHGASGIPAVESPGLFFRIVCIFSLVSGTLFMMWLGERISVRGIGNGSSIIIYSGIVANLPQSALRTLELGRMGVISTFVIVFILVGLAALICFVVFFERSYKKVPVHYTRGGSNMRQNVVNASYMPMKINISGVIPPIFASAMLSLPQALIQIFASSDSEMLMNIARYLSHGHPFFICLYVFLIIFFAYFYNPIVFNPEETAMGMKKGGAFIPGYRPGLSTQQFFESLLSKLTFIGSLYMAFVCVIPEIVLSMVSLQFYLGGTSLLIIVGVSMDVMTQIKSHLVGAKYSAVVDRPWLKS